MLVLTLFSCLNIGFAACKGKGKQGQDETLGMEHHSKSLPAKLPNSQLARASKTRSQARQQKHQEQRRQAVKQRLLAEQRQKPLEVQKPLGGLRRQQQSRVVSLTRPT